MLKLVNLLSTKLILIFKIVSFLIITIYRYMYFLFKKKPVLLNVILLLLSTFAIAQNETNNWYFGDKSGIDFNQGTVEILNNGSINTPAGCSTISSPTGELLFYTNGFTVWNKNHEIMANGSGLASDTNNTQTSIIVPKPGDENTFYIFCTRSTPGTDPLLTAGVFYSIVEFSDQSPLGQVTIKNSRINSSSTERITAIHDYQNDAIKIIAFGSATALPDAIKDTFFVFNLTENGLTYPSTRSTVLPTLSASGAMKISPNGETVCVADYEGRYLYFYHFDIANSSFTHLFTISTDLFGISIKPYGVEFSQDSKHFFYTGHTSGTSFLFQLKVNISNQEEEEEDLDNRIILDSSSDYSHGSLQLATNGKIYVSHFFNNGDDLMASNSISVINDPGNEDHEVDFQLLSLNLESGNSYKGLPNFISSFFRNRIITKDRCVDQIFDFSIEAYDEIDSVVWDFGDGTTSSTSTPTHQYTTAGEYVLKATISINNVLTTVYKQIKVFPLPQMAEGQTISNCDIDNDQTSFFNLNDSFSFIDNPRDIEFQQVFYNSLLDAENNENPIDHSEIYENTQNPEQIFVKNINPDNCSSISSFFIETSYTVLDPIDTMVVCEDSDDILSNNQGTFNLRTKSNAIRNQFGLSENYTLLYYTSLQDAQTNTNAIHLYYDTVSTTIWIKITTDLEECFGIAPIELIVNDSIAIDLEDSYTICTNNRQNPIILDGLNTNNTWHWEDSNGNILSTDRLFEINRAGIYTITVSKNQNGIVCLLSKSFEVLDAETPAFNEIVAENNSISVLIDGNSSYEFSIDNYVYFSSNNLHIFKNLSPAIYTVYVRDKYNCEPSIQTEVSLIGYPNHITPNGDNYNDIWKIHGLSDSFYNKVNINIFNRFGKLLHTMNLQSNQEGWNGTYNETPLQSTDYWYKVELTDKNNNISIKTGHFSLVN